MKTNTNITFYFLALIMSVAAAGARPNIIVLFADDLGYADVDFQPNNRSVVRSPHLRRLAYDGVRLSNHHVQPFCSPTRAATCSATACRTP